MHYFLHHQCRRALQFLSPKPPRPSTNLRALPLSGAINLAPPTSLTARRFMVTTPESSPRAAVENIIRSPIPDIEIPTNVSFHEYMFQKCDLYKDLPALKDYGSRKTYTYSQLKEKSIRVASALHRLGYRKGDVLLCFSPNNIDICVLMLACSCLGISYSAANPSFTPDELMRQVVDCDCLGIFTTPSLAQTVKDTLISSSHKVKRLFVFGEHPGFQPFNSLLDDDGRALPDVDINPLEDVYALPYSSGTTGLPKGVMLTHFNIVANCLQIRESSHVAVGERTLGLMPLYHIYGMVAVLYHVLQGGGLLVTLPRFEPESFLQCIQDLKIELMHVVPSLVTFLVKTPIVSNYDITSIKRIFSGASTLGEEISREFLGRHAHGVKIIQAYGTTETGSTNMDRGYRLGSIGTLHANTMGKIVDPETNQTLGPNELGEYWIKGPQIMKGYLNNQAATSSTITPDGWLRTGDLGYFAEDQAVYIKDRLKEIIKYKGNQVSPAELESSLLGLDGVLDVAVLGVPDEMAGELAKAFVMKRPGSQVSEEDIVRFVREKMSPTKWLRGGVQFVEAIPRTTSGKILRREIKEKYRLFVFGEHPGFQPFNSLLDDDGRALPDVDINPLEDVYALPYSSGTTGLPKGVMLTHFNIVANCLQIRKSSHVAVGERTLGLMPLYHIYGMVAVLYHVLQGGGLLVTLPRFEPESFLQCIQDLKIELMHVVPSLVTFLVKTPIVSNYDITSIKRIFSGASTLGEEISREFLGRHVHGVKIIQAYGTTETGSTNMDRGYRLGSIGTLHANTMGKIVDPETNQTLGPNELGEYWIKGPQIMKGYLNNQAATSSTITPDGWLRTGDLGYFAEDQAVYIKDRLKEIIKYKGNQVSPAELESSLLGLDGVLDVAVLGVPDEMAGELAKAFVMKRPGSQVSEEDIVRFVREKMSPTKWLRGGVQFVEAIPRTTSGKILRREIKEKYRLFVFGEHPGFQPFNSLLDDDGRALPDVDINPLEDVYALPYSSGTTGLPKGVMLTHFNIVANCLQIRKSSHVAVGERTLGLMPLYHIYGMVAVLYHVLQGGGLLVTLPRFEPESFLQCIQDLKIELMHVVPSLVTFLVKTPIVSNYDITSIKRIFSGASTLGEEISREFLGRHVHGVKIIQAYGTTETGSTNMDRGYRLGSIGTLHANTMGKIVDPETNQTLGPNELGEYWIKGPQIMKGYLNNQAATSSTITPDGWLRTGDLGYFAEDQAVYIKDRLKEIIKYKGNQVSPAELESSLLGLDGVLDVAVLGVPDEMAGELAKAFVMKRPGSQVSEEDIVRFVREKMSPTKWLRGGVQFVEAIPRTTSGKILRREIKEKYVTGTRDSIKQ